MYRAHNPTAPGMHNTGSYGDGASSRYTDSHTKVTYKKNPGYFERVGSSFCGITVGIVVLLAAFPVLFLNEGRAVQTAKSLDEGLRAVVSLDSPDMIFDSNENKLVHLSGGLVTDKALFDSEFNVGIHAVKLKRTVEMYQWVEHENKREYKEGDRTRVETTYSYSLTSKISNYRDMNLERSPINGKYVLLDNAFHKSWDPYRPQVGDLRIRFSYAGKSHKDYENQRDTVSIVAKQNSMLLKSYQTEAGDVLELLYHGVKTAKDIFDAEHSSNKILTWAIRFVGWLMMFIGLQIMMDIVRQIVSFLPIIRDIVGLATSIIAFSIATSLALLTIAIGWLRYRPLLAIALTVGAAVPFYLSRRKAEKDKSNKY